MKITIDLDRLVAHLESSYSVGELEWYGSNRGMAASVFYEFFKVSEKADAVECMRKVIEETGDKAFAERQKHVTADRTGFRDEHSDFFRITNGEQP